MKKHIIAAILALSFSTPASAGDLGIYFGDTLFLTYSSHKADNSGLTFNMHWGTKDTGDTYFGNQIAFQTFGIGAGYAYDDLMDNLSISASLGYGSSDVKIENTNLASKESSSGLYYHLGADYSLKPIIKLPISVGARIISVPTFDWTTTTGAKTYGGSSLVLGASFLF